MITSTQILEANRAGLRHQGTEIHWEYATPVLQAAYDLGWINQTVSDQVVTGHRYGNAPVDGIGINHSEGKREFGLSLAGIEGGMEIASVIFFSNRGRVSYTGLLSPLAGSDGEPIMLMFDVYNAE
jgi:hypothetical protein